ncbi:MAG: metallophosphoesterase [Candidatus Schekmanbacteria bacterium]|nr:metallophosphoesterase [Candidatus Schekmanbacteria bacterium]
MRVWITADVHHGNPGSKGVTRELAGHFLSNAERDDVLVLAGDIGEIDGIGLRECLGEFARFPGVKALVPGNHDLWTHPGSGQGTWHHYRAVLPRIAAEHGFQMLDVAPLRVALPHGGALGIAGSYGGYDFTMADVGALASDADRSEVLQAFRVGRFRTFVWSDYTFFWDRDGAFDLADFSRSCTAKLEQDVRGLQDDPAITAIAIITHTGGHIDVVRDHPLGLDKPLVANVWFHGVAGTVRIGEIAMESDKVRLVACGHTHHDREVLDEAGRCWINVGCNYSRKRWVAWDPAGGVQVSRWFGDAAAMW